MRISADDIVGMPEDRTFQYPIVVRVVVYHSQRLSGFDLDTTVPVFRHQLVEFLITLTVPASYTSVAKDFPILGKQIGGNEQLEMIIVPGTQNTGGKALIADSGANDHICVENDPHR